MHWLLQLSFLALHLFVYILILRHLPVFQRERSIFAFHSVPFFGLVIAGIIGWSFNRLGITTIAGMLSLQLIYSMTFLEAWSLAEGSYSLQILLQVAQHPTRKRSAVTAATRSIGARKKSNRLRSLMEIGLACETYGKEVRLTGTGRLVTAFFRAIKVLANIKAAG